ncbi:multiheme c-type cytochrome [Thioalkalivibrio paradoxus]|uniref:multiheme c-type cytochrome n=1 Tax=Thioalkalivibrio paradoxus TaxID=108010 RepID=UPI00022C0F74|nr:multiheme c-type cytochrome [Thioalkalivibrio paradoxus]
MIGGALRPLLALLFLLFVLLAVNSLYLAGITFAEFVTGRSLQGYLYLLMVVLHLGLGLLLIPVFLAFVYGHLRRAWGRRNRYAVGAGVALAVTGLLLIGSGLMLVRFDFLAVHHPAARAAFYWLHVAAPLAIVWLFLLHRLAGPRLRWRAGLRWAGVAAMLALATAGLHLYHPEQGEPTAVATFEPALTRLAATQSSANDTPTLPPERLMRDAFCAECHADIADQHAASMHRFSSFNNPVYRFSVEETRAVVLERDGNVQAARFCAGCHDPLPLFSGAFDRPDYDPDRDPAAEAGITCLVCHAVTEVNSPRGNADFTLVDPPRYPFEDSTNAWLAALGRQLIRAKPAYHKRTLLRPLHQEPEFCSTCHKVGLPQELNHYRWLRGQDHYGTFLASGVSGHRVDSFYYPERAETGCTGCHMPYSASRDPAARAFPGQGVGVHDHRFAAANTAIPQLLGRDASEIEARQDFLRDRVARIDLFGIKEDGRIDGELHAPLRPELPKLEPGNDYLLEVVLRTLRIGHPLTQGTSDSNDLWLEVLLRDGDGVIGHSGALGPDGDVDPWAHFVNAYVLDRDGNRIDRRNVQDIFVALYDHQVPPGAAAVVQYRFTVPDDAQGPLTIDAALHYRKFDTRLMRHVQGESFTRNDLPITTLAADRLTLPLAGNTTAPPQEHPVAPWERWNDYGIGLLRTADRDAARGQLRQAETAFQQVERLGRADGPLNLARVYFREGRLDDAARALARAREAEAPPWTLAWYAALIDREYGRLDAAADRLEALYATRFQEARDRGFDFSRDLRVAQLLGRTRFEQARAARGEARSERRQVLLQQAREALQAALAIDPEAAAVHHTMAQVLEQLGDPEAAAQHRAAHERYRPDDLAIATAVARHRAANPAANQAAEALTLYDLQRTVRDPTALAWREVQGQDAHPRPGMADDTGSRRREHDPRRQETR